MDHYAKIRHGVMLQQFFNLWIRKDTRSIPACKCCGRPEQKIDDFKLLTKEEVYDIILSDHELRKKMFFYPKTDNLPDVSADVLMQKVFYGR